MLDIHCADRRQRHLPASSSREGPWPSNMTFFVDIDDLAAYRKKIAAAGGKIMVDNQEVPGMGRLCLFTDPQGRMLGLWKGN